MNTQREAAETLALQAMAWLVADDDARAAFLAATGAGPGDLAAGAQHPEFLASVLDFLLGDDARIIAFCDSADLPYTAPLAARAWLPGGDATHWT